NSILAVNLNTQFRHVVAMATFESSSVTLHCLLELTTASVGSPFVVAFRNKENSFINGKRKFGNTVHDANLSHTPIPLSLNDQRKENNGYPEALRLLLNGDFGRMLSLPGIPQCYFGKADIL
ncbi:hypothetical protein STEG23_008325, partial [Scotinomys teguina]